MFEPWSRLPALSLKQIQYFVTLAQLRHFTETANRLGISQPALSSALRQIEWVLGGKLVNRSSATVTLTDMGAAILPHAERLLNIAQITFDDMQRIMLHGGSGTLRIGMVPSVSNLLFPHISDRLSRQFPSLRIQYCDQTNDTLLAQLTSGQIDVGIGALDSTVPGSLEVYPLQEDPFVAVLRGDDPLADAHHLTWRQLLHRDLALFATGNTRRMVQALLESHQLSLSLRYQVDFIETLYGLVRANLAVAILPRLYTRHLHDDSLRVVGLQQPLLTRKIALMRSLKSPAPALSEECFQFLLQALSEAR